MAIINCPGCGKKTTEISSHCPHCGYKRGQVDDERRLELRRRVLRDRVYHLNMTSYAAISVFVAAFGWYWWDSSGYQQSSSSGPIILLTLASGTYVVIRFFLFRARKLLKISY